MAVMLFKELYVKIIKKETVYGSEMSIIIAWYKRNCTSYKVINGFFWKLINIYYLLRKIKSIHTRHRYLIPYLLLINAKLYYTYLGKKESLVFT